MNTFDMHCDTIYQLHFKNQDRNNSLLENNLHIDLKRLQKIKAMGQFFALFFDSADKTELRDGETPWEVFQAMYNTYDREMLKNTDKIKRVLKYSDITSNKEEGLLSSILTIEGGESIMGDLDKLKKMSKMGVKGITLTWNNENEIGYPNSHVNFRECGLKPKGIEIINSMNELGMFIDVSHLSDGGFWDVIHHSKKPVIASHSNARTLCDHSRNLSDKMIKALANNGGISGLNFCSAFLDGTRTTKIKDLVKHSLYLIDKGGEDFLALGTDYDGIGSTLEIEDISKMYLLEDALKKGGLKSSQIEKIFYKNTLRVLKETI